MYAKTGRLHYALLHYSPVVYWPEIKQAPQHLMFPSFFCKTQLTPNRGQRGQITEVREGGTTPQRGHLHQTAELRHRSFFLTSSPLLRFVGVPRFSLGVSGRREPVCRRSAAAWGLDGLSRRLSRRLVRGGVSVTAARLMAELEAACKLFMLQDTRKEFRRFAHK